MSQGIGWGTPSPYAGPSRSPARTEPGGNLADILERVLDKGIIIAGDIRVNLLDIELLTIKIRLLIASVDRARDMGIDWWEHDPTLSSGRRDLIEENRQLRNRLGELEKGRSAGDGLPTSRGAGREPRAERARPREERSR